MSFLSFFLCFFFPRNDSASIDINIHHPYSIVHRIIKVFNVYSLFGKCQYSIFSFWIFRLYRQPITYTYIITSIVYIYLHKNNMGVDWLIYVLFSFFMSRKYTSARTAYYTHSHTHMHTRTLNNSQYAIRMHETID